MIHYTQLHDVCEVNQLGEIRVSIPDQLHRELKQVALDKGTSLKQLIVDVLQLYTSKEDQGNGSNEKEATR